MNDAARPPLDVETLAEAVRNVLSERCWSYILPENVPLVAAEYARLTEFAQPAAPETEREDDAYWQGFGDGHGKATEDMLAAQPAAPETERLTAIREWHIGVRHKPDTCDVCFLLAAQPAAPETERLREAARKTIAAWDDNWIGCADMQPMVEALRAALQAGSPAQDHPSDFLDCETHWRKSDHDRAIVATATETERLREGYPVNVDLEDNPTLVGWVLDHD